MAGPPPVFDQFGLGPRNATFRTAGFAAPTPRASRRRRLQPRRPRGEMARLMLAWSIAIAGYAALLAAAHGSSHADELHALAVVWLMVSGATSAHLMMGRR